MLKLTGVAFCIPQGQGFFGLMPHRKQLTTIGNISFVNLNTMWHDDFLGNESSSCGVFFFTGKWGGLFGSMGGKIFPKESGGSTESQNEE